MALRIQEVYRAAVPEFAPDDLRNEQNGYAPHHSCDLGNKVQCRDNSLTSGFSWSYTHFCDAGKGESKSNWNFVKTMAFTLWALVKLNPWARRRYTGGALL